MATSMARGRGKGTCRTAKGREKKTETNRRTRRGGGEAAHVKKQADKVDRDQPPIAGTLRAADEEGLADVAVVGCGPAGVALAAELGRRGAKVTLVGPDAPFVNNYGVWLDEFQEIGMEDCLDQVWESALCYTREDKEIEVNRPYARVCRRKLREKLLQRCRETNVTFLPTMVQRVEDGTHESRVVCADGKQIRAKVVAVAAGASGADLIQYEDEAEHALAVASQTAYGIECEVDSYPWPKDKMLFMDFRRHHSGLWKGAALRRRDEAGFMAEKRQEQGLKLGGGDGDTHLWGTEDEVPSFLYAMPMADGKVFLEETCLVARPGLPFDVLKRRLEGRLRALDIKVTRVHDEEWSYIPMGGPLPCTAQQRIAFGAAAGLVHPATGYSIARSLKEAPAVADALISGLGQADATAHAVTQCGWGVLWSEERKRQASFHIFGMELLAKLSLKEINEFFETFFILPEKLWRGFLSSKLSSLELLGFALVFFVYAPNTMRFKLLEHLAKHPAGKLMIQTYTAQLKHSVEPQEPAEISARPQQRVPL